MSNAEIVRAMDTADGMEISVSIYRDTVVLSDTTTLPYHSLHLSAAEARKLAEILTEQAVAVEAYDA